MLSALAVVGTGVGIAWGTHVFQKKPQVAAGQPLASPTSAPLAKGAGGIVASAGAGLPAPRPSSPDSAAPSSSAPSGAPTSGGGPSATAKPSLNLPHATGSGTVTVLHVPSADTDMKTRDVYVYRPAVPANVVLPVVYLLHGVPGEPSTMMGTVRSTLDAAFTTGGLAPFEVAAPTGGGTNHSDTEWADAADGGDLVETYLIKQVIPAVEGSTSLPASERAIVGFSMGGYGAANLALRHPDMFSQFVSLAGYFHVDDPSGMFAGDSAREAANTPDDMVKLAAGKRVLLLEDADESDPLISGGAQEFADRLVACHCGIDVNWHIEPGGHDYDFVASVFPKVISFLDLGF
jgi:S-formylglutathione hydrolase FrmB